MSGVLFKSFPVTGVEDSDGDLRVVGRCSDGAVDHDGDIVSPSWMASAVKEYMSTFPAVRLQHRGDAPIGKALEAWQDDQGATWLKSLIVDAEAQRMVRKGVLAAYSVGISAPETRKSARAPRFEIVGGRLTEVSLVDEPSNARCGITVCKSKDGAAEYIGRAFKVGKSGKVKVSKPGKVKFTEQELLAFGEAALGVDPVTAMFLGSRNPALVALAEAGLRGG